MRPGSTLRGEASCNLSERILEVPLGVDGRSRVVRAHELMHARVSPHGLAWATLFADVAPRALECAEEFRINTLLDRLRFDVSLLCDGSEKGGGRRLAEAGEWGQAACFLFAVLGTGAERDYLAGIRAGSPSWLPALRALRKRAHQLVADYSTTALGATKRNSDGIPQGYAQTTVVLARLLTQSMVAQVPADPEALRRFRRSLEPGGRRPPTGQFADLHWATDLDMRARARAPGVRARRASTSGTVLRFPGRLLTDPQRRAFARAVHRHGGVVVIDQSGSMDLAHHDLIALLALAPNALVVGYSHRPGDRGASANAWVLARRGAVATSCPAGNVGNGVDGPVLRWAIGQRVGREPIVWMTDGQVTDSHDHPSEALTSECAALVLTHQIRLVRDLSQVGRAISGATTCSTGSLTGFGRLGRKIAETRP